jgi:hypothetical protein
MCVAANWAKLSATAGLGLICCRGGSCSRASVLELHEKLDCCCCHCLPACLPNCSSSQVVKWKDRTRLSVLVSHFLCLTLTCQPMCIWHCPASRRGSDGAVPAA